MFLIILLPIFLVKIVAITILESPQSVQVVKGLPATLKCRTSSVDTSITWYKDGSKHDRKKGRCLLLPDGSLFFLSTRAEDTGKYHCEVTDRSDVVRSRSARLSVVENGMDKDEFSQEGSEKQDKAVDYFLPKKLNPPKDITAQLLLDGTGVVSWTISAEVRGYLIQVMAGNTPVTNISVDSSVDTVHIHNLSAAHQYSVSVAAVKGNTQSAFSERKRLYLSPLTKHTKSYASSIPTQIWVIAFLAAIMMTLIIILLVSIIVIKTRRVPAVTAGNAMEYRQAARTDRQTSQNIGSDQNSDYQTRLYMQDDVYAYVTSDQCAISAKSSDISSDYGQNQHYAYTQINQQLITSNSIS